MYSEALQLIEQTTSDPAFLERYPLYAAVLARLHPIVDPSVRVMAVSKDHRGAVYLHVNVEFFERSPEYLHGILLHEVHHIVLGHLSHPQLRGVAHPDLMELAQEMSANEYIRADLPEGAVRWEDFRDVGIRRRQSTLERYRLLAQARNSGKLPSLPRIVTVDDHVADGLGRGNRGNPMATEEDLQALRDLLRGIQEETTSEGGPRAKLAGSTPGSLLLSLADGPASAGRALDWRRELERFATRMTRRPVCTYQRANRRFPNRVGEIPGRTRRPGGHSDKPHLMVVIDTSGSMSPPVLGEIAGQLSPIARYSRVTIVECDAEIQRVYPFVGAIRSLQGRGGTDFQPVFEPSFLRAHAPDGVVYFTDGFGAYPETEPAVKTLWVLTAHPAPSPPWGDVVHMEPPGTAGLPLLFGRRA